MANELSWRITHTYFKKMNDRAIYASTPSAGHPPDEFQYTLMVSCLLQTYGDCIKMVAESRETIKVSDINRALAQSACKTSSEGICVVSSPFQPSG